MRAVYRDTSCLDGIEVLSSYSRCWDACLERRVPVRKGGVKVEQVQYYHRAVACQIVSSPVKALLALEWLQPGESEDAAALRLLHKLPAAYGSRFFDILLLDALYAQATVLQCAAEHNWNLVISLKRNRPELYESTVRLFARRPPDLEFTETRQAKTYQGLIWDTPGLPLCALLTRSWSGWSVPRRSLLKTTIDAANCGQKLPPTNGCGSRPWKPGVSSQDGARSGTRSLETGEQRRE